MKYGYMGLNSEYETTWADGRNVIIYPDGSVIDTNKGTYIRNADNISSQPEKVIIPQQYSQNQNLLFIGMFIIGIVAIVALSRRN